jgi:hypothetical protein
MEKIFESTATKVGSKTLIALPFDPHDTWGRKERHYVSGSINGNPVRGLLVFDGTQFFLPVGAAWCRDHHLTHGTPVKVLLVPEGPQFEHLSDDIALALEAVPQAKKVFESLATFYRKNYIGWIESARRPETRQARIAEMVRLLVAGKKQK